jgi:hypothetical protein
MNNRISNFCDCAQQFTITPSSVSLRVLVHQMREGHLFIAAESFA